MQGPSVSRDKEMPFYQVSTASKKGEWGRIGHTLDLGMGKKADVGFRMENENHSIKNVENGKPVFS